MKSLGIFSKFRLLDLTCRYSWKENLLLKNEDEALINELRYLKRNGCQSLVELTILGLDRNVGKLMELSSASGVNVVAGTGESSRQTLSLSLRISIRYKPQLLA